MDEWYDVLPCLQYKQLVWSSQCSQLCHAISESHIQHAQWKTKGLNNCAKKGDVEGVKYLVERCGADVHADYDWVLILASRDGQLDVVKYLVEKGADVHALYECALRAASMNGHLEVVKYLVEDGGADVHAEDECALQWASSNGHLEVVKYLVDKGADVHAEYEEALRLANHFGHLEVVEYLKSKGAFLL